MHNLIVMIVFLVLFCLPGSQAHAQSKSEAKQIVFTVNLARFINLRCNYLTDDKRRKFEWTVELFNLALANGIGRKIAESEVQDARNTAKTPPYVECKSPAKNAVLQGILDLGRTKFQRSNGAPVKGYEGGNKYRSLMSGRMTQVILGLNIGEKCSYFDPKTKRATLNVREETLTLFAKYMGVPEAKKSSDNAKHEMMFISNTRCKDGLRYKFDVGMQVLYETRQLLKMDLNQIPRTSFKSPEIQQPSAKTSTTALSKPSFRLSNKGHIKIKMGKTFADGTSDLEKIFRRTLQSKHPSNIKRRDPSWDLIYPKEDMTALGTIYRKPVRGFHSAFDKNAINFMEPNIVRRKIKGAILSGVILRQSLESLLENDKTARAELKRYFASSTIPNLTSLGILAIVEDIEVTYLPMQGTDKLPALINDNSGAGDNHYFLVMDAVVMAKRIDYLIGPAHFKRNLFRVDFESAKELRANVTKKNGIYVISRVWKNRRAVGVGHSILGLTKSGKRRARIRGSGLSPEALFYLSKQVNDIVASN